MPRIRPKSIGRDHTLRMLWLLVGISFATFATVFLKLETASRLYLTPPLALIILIAGLSLTGVAFRKRLVVPPVMEGDTKLCIFVLMLLFVIFHLIGTVRAFEWIWALRETIKITISFIVFWCVLYLFPDDEDFRKMFWAIILLFSVFLVSVLTYRYFVVFNRPYLGNSWEIGVRQGRNLLGWYLALVVPLATASALALRRGYFALVGATILIAAIIYTGSRSSMAIAGLGIVISVLLLLANRRYRNLVIQRLILVISLTIGVLIYFWNDVILLMENFEFYFRIAAAISNQSNSGDIRMRLIQRAFECYQNDSLIFGMGVKNIVACIGQDTTLSKDMVVHNDFVSVLTDTGILGAVTYCAIFLVIIFVMAKKLKMLKFDVSWVGAGLIGSTVAGIVSLNFTTGYNSPLLWTILSLALVALPQPRPSDRKLVKQDLMPHQG